MNARTVDGVIQREGEQVVVGDVLTTAALLHHCAQKAGRWSAWAGPALAVWDARDASVQPSLLDGAA